MWNSVKSRLTPFFIDVKMNLFLAGFLMFAFSGLGAACLELMFYISVYGEVLATALFYLYAAKKAGT